VRVIKDANDSGFAGSGYRSSPLKAELKHAIDPATLQSDTHLVVNLGSPEVIRSYAFKLENNLLS
jgi:hypothetical protein